MNSPKASPRLAQPDVNSPKKRLKMAQAAADRLAIEMELRRTDLHTKSRINQQHFNSLLAQQNRQSATSSAERLRAEMDLRRAAMFHKVHSMIEKQTQDRQSIRKEEHLQQLSEIEQRSQHQQDQHLSSFKQSLDASKESKSRLSQLADQDIVKVRESLIKQAHETCLANVNEHARAKEEQKMAHLQSLEDQKSKLRESLGVDQSLVKIMSKLAVQSFDEEGKRQYRQLTEEIRQMEQLHKERVSTFNDSSQSISVDDSLSSTVEMSSINHDSLVVSRTPEDELIEQRKIIRDQLSRFSQQQQLLSRLQEEHMRVVEELKMLEKEKSNAESSLLQMTEDFSQLNSEKNNQEKKLKSELKLIKSTLSARERQLEELRKQREKERERAELLNQQLEDKQKALQLAARDRELLKEQLRKEWEYELRVKEEVQFVVSWLICETVAHYEHWLVEENRKKKDKVDKLQQRQSDENQAIESLKKSITSRNTVKNDNLIDESDGDDLSFVDDDVDDLSEGDLDLIGVDFSEHDLDGFDTSDLELEDFSESEIDGLVEIPESYRLKLKELIKSRKNSKNL
ncbi:hypothetical protein RCL1_005533 [Eukaryota sp. TZLM3-RCL]